MSVVDRGAARLRRRCAVVFAAFSSLMPTLLQAQQQTAEDVTVLSAVKVTDTEEETRTEGSGSYVTPKISIGKDALSVRETPQAVSVFTRQRLDDQNITNVPDAMKNATGVNVQRFDGAGLFSNYYVRGYVVDAIQLDGLSFGNSGNSTEFDAAIYDHIEILRGPAGLFQGAGEPGASVNLSRKRALDHTQFGGMLGGGGWNAYRSELDATTALNASGSLRVRGVAVFDDRDSYQDIVHSRKNVQYGTLEYDFDPATTLSIGAARQEIDSVINQGLPAYADGTLLDVPRSTFIGADWNELDIDAHDYFAELEHRLANGGTLKFAVRHLEREMLYKVARANSAVDADGNVAIQTGLYTPDRKNWAADIYANLPFSAFGKTHNLLVGADLRTQDEEVHSSPFANAADRMNVFDPDHDIVEPDFVYSSHTDTKTTQYGIYSQIRYRLFDPLTLVGGARVTWWETKGRDLNTKTTTSDYDQKGKTTPFAALIYDVLPQVSLYASYADIFQPQAQTTSSGEQLKPRTGGSVEAGVKGEFLQGRLITQFAVFQLQDENRAITDPNDSLFSVASGKVRNRGFETEISGELMTGWDVTLGYTYLDTEYRKTAATAANGQQAGQDFAPFTPMHTVKLWTQYLFHNGVLDGLSVGGGIHSYSSFYAASGASRFTAGGETLLSGKLGYRIDDHWSANLVASNLLDEKYYEKVSYAGRQNFYGEPRNFSLSLRASF